MLPMLKALCRDRMHLGALCALALVVWLQFALVLHQDEHDAGSVATACHACLVLKSVGHALLPSALPALEATVATPDALPTLRAARPSPVSAYRSRAPPLPAAEPRTSRSG